MACRSCTEFLHCERGGGTILGLFWFILLVGITGLAVDITDALRHQTMLQATADAAATAAVLDLPDEDVVVASALIYADKNMSPVQHGVTLEAADVEIGVWDPDTRTFSAGTRSFSAITNAYAGTLANAVRVTLHRSDTNGNPLAANFLRIAGVRDWDITVQAVAMAGVGGCLQGGFIARVKIFSGSTNNYLDRLCIHGQQGVKIGSTNYFESGVEVTMLDYATFVQSQENAGIDDALGERDYDPPLPDQVPSIVSGLMDGSLIPPSYIKFGPVHVQYLPANPSPHTLYVVDEVVDFGSDAIIHNLAVVSLQEIKVGSRSELSNVLLVSMNKISFGSENLIGSRAYCADGHGSVQMFAFGDITLGSQTEYSGVQIVSSNSVYLGSELVSLTGITVQAGGDIDWGSAEVYSGCG